MFDTSAKTAEAVGATSVVSSQSVPETSSFTGSETVRGFGRDDPLQSVREPHRPVRDTVSAVRSGIDDIGDRLPGRTGEAFVAGAGLAAVPEPSPVTEVTGGAIAGGAALIGGGILASRALQNNELEISEGFSSELNPSRSRRERVELALGNSPVFGTQELEPSGTGVTATEVDTVSPTAGSELDISGSTETDGPTRSPFDDSVVPSEFPLAGRDFPRRPDLEAGREPNPQDFVGSADAATGVTIGSGLGETSRRERQSVFGSGAPTESEILDEVRRDFENPAERDGSFGFRRERQFPTGESAVIGRETAQFEQATQPELTTETTLGVSSGFGGPGQNPVAGAIDEQERARAPGLDPFGRGIGAGVGVGAGFTPGFGTESGVGIGTEPGAGSATEPGLATGTDTATQQEQLFMVAADALTGTQQETAATAQETAFENAFGQPNLSEVAFEFGTGTGTAPGIETPRIDIPRGGDDEEIPQEEDNLFDDVFDSGIADAETVLGNTNADGNDPFRV